MRLLGVVLGVCIFSCAQAADATSDAPSAVSDTTSTAETESAETESAPEAAKKTASHSKPDSGAGETTRSTTEPEPEDSVSEDAAVSEDGESEDGESEDADPEIDASGSGQSGAFVVHLASLRARDPLRLSDSGDPQDWAMIEQDQQSVLFNSWWPKLDDPDVVPQQPTPARLRASYAVMNLYRTDKVEMTTSGGAQGDVHQTLTSGTNPGMRLHLIGQPAWDPDVPRKLEGLEFLFLGCSGEDTVDYSNSNGDTFRRTTNARLGNIELNVRTVPAVFNGMFRGVSIGFRGLQMKDSVKLFDQYHHMYATNDRVDSSNLLLGPQLGWRTGAQSRHLYVGCELKGGLFYNHSRQTGPMFDGARPVGAHLLYYDVTDDSFASLVDATLEAALRLTDRARLGIGLYGLGLRNVSLTRNGWGSPNHSGRIAYYGSFITFNYDF